jgi:hypothetical protein
MQNERRDHIGSDGPWGDKHKHKAPSTFRYCFGNINGLPITANKEKHDRITTSMKKHQIDLLGMAEISVNFHKVGPTNQWKDRFKRLRTNSHCATNVHTNANEQKVHGGTAYLTSVTTSNRVINKGADPHGLGRWTWALLSGRQGIKTRIILGYRPVPDPSNKTGTVFSQHEQYFIDRGTARNPRQAFLEDLRTQIIQWIVKGNIIILGLDLNDKTWNSAAAKTIEAWGLSNVHKTAHPSLLPVATCNKNWRNIPIDGIWCSPSIDIVSASMTGFGSLDVGKTDHRMLWADFYQQDDLFGYQPPPPSHQYNKQEYPSETQQLPHD